MFGISPCHGDEIVVMGDDHPALGKGEGNLSLIGDAEQPGFDRRRNINTMAAKPHGNRRADAFVKMVSNHRGRL